MNAFSAAVAAGITHFYHRMNASRVVDSMAPPPYVESIGMAQLVQSMPSVPASMTGEANTQIEDLSEAEESVVDLIEV